VAFVTEFQVFFAPSPMKENILQLPSTPRMLTTVLLVTAMGSESTRGSVSEAARNAKTLTRAKRQAKSFFIVSTIKLGALPGKVWLPEADDLRIKILKRKGRKENPQKSRRKADHGIDYDWFRTRCFSGIGDRYRRIFLRGRVLPGGSERPATA